MKTNHSETLDSSIIVPRSSLRILLWDIDGTLIRSERAGA
jgi:phosphatidate phosphatase PAH1